MKPEGSYRRLLGDLRWATSRSCRYSYGWPRPRLDGTCKLGIMWIFSRLGFYSIACARNKDGSLDTSTVMVRARRKAHLQNLQKRFLEIAATEIRATPKNDYGYRLIIPKAQWAQMLADMAMEQEWSNFKKEAACYQGQTGADYVGALHKIWAIMYDLQLRRLR